MPKHAEHLNQIEQAISIKYNNRVYEMKEEGLDVVVLSLGEAFFDIPLQSFSDLPLPAGFHYSHSRGLLELREKLAAYYGTSHSVPINPRTECLVTAGSKLAIHISLMTVLAPGDEAIIFEPAWVSYSEQVKLCRGAPKSVPCTEGPLDVEKYITPKTRAIIVNNPNNPTGRVLTGKEILFLHDVAKRNDVFLIADETYSDVVLDRKSFVSFGVSDSRKEHTIICNSLSKNLGLSGWRLGFAVANADLTAQMLKINQHLLTCPATILQYYMARHFDDLLRITEPQRRDVVRKRGVIADYLTSLGLAHLPGSATFYLFVSIAGSGLSSDEFCMRLLSEYRVCAVPGIAYGKSCAKYLRISVGTESIDRIKRGINAIHELLRKTSFPRTRSEYDRARSRDLHPAL